MLLLRTSRGVDPGIPLLRSLGSNAHVWLPGANGVSVASLPSNNYLLSDGSTGYSTVDGVDGLTLDGMGVTTNLTVSQDLSTWTSSGAFLNWNGSTATATTITTTGIGGSRYVRYACTPGTRVTFAATVVAGTTTGSVAVVFGTSGLGYISDSASSIVVSGAVYVSAIAPANAAYVELVVRGTGSGLTVGFTNLASTINTGTHLTQATTANKPLVRRGMLNLLTYSNTLTDWSWLKGGGGTITYDAVGVDGAANTAATITTTTAVLRSITRVTGVTSSVGAAFTTAFWLKKTTGALARYPVISLEEVSITRLLGICTVDTSNGVVTAWSAYTGFPINAGSTVSIVSSGDYWLVTLSGFCSGATATVAGLFPASASTSTQSTGTISGAVGPDVICGGSLVASGTWTAAQILAEGGIPTTTATAASSPSAGKYWWSFDGSNDALALGSVPFEMTDDSVVIVGCRNQGASAVDYMVAIKGANYTNVGSLYFASGRPGAVWFDNSYGLADILHASTLYTPAVITSVKRTNAKQLRINGVQSGATNNTVMDTTTVTNAWIGGGSAITAGVLDSAYSFDGSISIVIVVKGTLTDAELLLLERFAASVTPNGPVF